jgi:hypothetical protein
MDPIEAGSMGSSSLRDTVRPGPVADPGRAADPRPNHRHASRRNRQKRSLKGL